jgi:acyl carrier protein
LTDKNFSLSIYKIQKGVQMETTLARIQSIVGEQLGIEAESVVPEANFTKDLGADSLDVVELVMAVEEAFEIEIDDKVAGQIETVGDVLEYLEKLNK